MSIHLVNETTVVYIYRKRLTKNFRIENVHEMRPGEHLSFDINFDRNVYIMNIRVQSIANVKDQLCVDINNHEDNAKRIMEFEVIFKNDSGHKVFQKSDILKPDKPFTPLVINTKYSLRDLPGGYLLVICNLNYISWIEEDDRPKESEKSTLSGVDNLLQDLGQLFSQKQNADVTVHVGKTAIPVHSLILSARSKVFAAMFEHDMSEKKDRIIKIDDIDALPLHHFLKYLYTGTLEVKDMRQDTLSGVYAAADKYEVMDLKKMCADFMLSKLSSENMATFAALGFRHNDKRMQDAVVAFLTKNMRLLHSSDWRDLEEIAPDVADDLLNIILPKKRRN